MGGPQGFPWRGVQGRTAAGTAGAVFPVRVARCLGWPRAGGGRGRRPSGSQGVQAAGVGVDGPRAPAWCWISGQRPEQGHQRVTDVTAPRVPAAAARARTCSRSRGAAPTGPPPWPATTVLSPRATQGPGDKFSVPSLRCLTEHHPLHPTLVTTGDGGAQAEGDLGGGHDDLSSSRHPPVGCSIRVTPSLTPLTAPADAAPDADGL